MLASVAHCHRSSWAILRSLLCACLFVLVASTAFADSVRLIVDRVLVWNRPTGVAVVVTQLPKDQVVELVRRVGDWYEIVLPSVAGSYQTGFIRVSQAELVTAQPGSASTGLPPTAPASSPQGRAAGRAPQPRRQRAGFTNLSGGYRLEGEEIVRVSGAFEEIYAEAGSLSTRYFQKPAWGVDVLAGQTLWGPIGIAVGIGYHQREAPASVEAVVPHPFFFNQPRTTTFDTLPLTAKEFALHVPVFVMPAANSRMRVIGFGGFSLFHVRQNAVTGATLNDPYPHNTVTVTSEVTEEKKGTVPGYHAGGDISFFFSRSAGIGAGVRYSRGTLKFKGDEGTTTTGYAGGLEALAGLRFRF